MNVTVEVNKTTGLGCDHIELEYTGGERTITRVYTLTAIRQDFGITSVEQAVDIVNCQIKKVILANPEATLGQLKTAVEAEIYRV